MSLPTPQAGQRPEDADASHTLIGVSFADQYRAREYLTAMARLNSLGKLKIRDAVTVARNADGAVRVTETIDPTPGRAALSGAMWSGLLGALFGGPVGWLAGMGIGAGVGALGARFVDLGIPDEWVEWFRQAVVAGTTTVIIMVEEFDARAYEQELERFAGARLVYATLPPATLDDLRRALRDGGLNPDEGQRGSVDADGASETA